MSAVIYPNKKDAEPPLSEGNLVRIETPGSKIIFEGMVIRDGGDWFVTHATYRLVLPGDIVSHIPEPRRSALMKEIPRIQSRIARIPIINPNYI